MRTRIIVLLLLLVPLNLAAQTTCTIREITQVASKAFLYCDGARSEISIDLYHNHGGNIRTLCPPEATQVFAAIEDQWDTPSGYPEHCDVRQNGLDAQSRRIQVDTVGEVLIDTRTSPIVRDGSNRLTVETPPQGVTLRDNVLTVDQARVRTQRWFEPSTAHAAVAYVADTSFQVGTLSSSITVSHTISAGSDRLLLATNSYRCTNGNICPTDQTATFNAVSMTINTTNQLDDEVGVKVFRLVAPNVTTADVVITLTGNSTRMVAGAVSFSGADQTTPLGTAVTSNTLSGLTVTCGTTVPADGISFGVAAKNDSAQAVTTTAGTEQFNLASDHATSTNNMIGVGATRTTTGNFTWTHSTTNRSYRCISVPINAAVAAVGGTSIGVHLLPR